MSPADLDDAVPFPGLCLQHFREPPERRQQLSVDASCHGDVNRGGERVVGALPHVDVVIGVNRFLFVEAVPTVDLNRPV